MFLDRVNLAFKFIRRQARTRQYPTVVGIETTNRCNLRCVMCPRQEMTRKLGDLDLGLFERIVDDLKDRVEFIWLQDYGEPFLHRDIFDFIALAKSRNLKTGISTNATVLNDRIIQGIFDSGLDYIIFAFDGASKETYEAVRIGADFGRVSANIREFLARKNRARARIFTVVQCICMEQTQDELSRFISAWRVKGVDALRIRQLTYSGKESPFRNDNGSRPCYWLWTNPHIKYDGTVVPCCQDVNATLPLGNIAEQSLGQLWNGGKMRELRQAHIDDRQNEIPLCRACNMYQPRPIFALGSALLPYHTVNRLVPKIETTLSLRRFSSFGS
jgi:radical SAM protein with 4Fe4S-binding SPASM domain